MNAKELARRIRSIADELDGTAVAAQIKADEARREAERQAKAAKEAQRIAGHQAALDAPIIPAIRGFLQPAIREAA